MANEFIIKNGFFSQGNSNVTGSLNVTAGITGSLLGTASFASTAVTASYVQNAVSASYATQAVSSSFATTATSSSYAVSASYSVTSSFARSGSYAVTSSYSVTSSYAIYAETASLSTRTTQTDLLALNQNGFTIPKGTVVRITGSNNASDIPRIVTASYENDGNSANTLGIATEAILNGATGYIITEGVLTGIDTSNFTSGTLLYLGATGSIIGTAPLAPLHAVRLGQVIREQSNNGSMHVRIDNGYEIGELHDIRDTTTSASYGDLLVKSGSVWTNSKQLSGSYSITGSLTISGSSTFKNIGPTILSGSFKVQGAGDGVVGPFAAIEIDDANYSRNLYDYNAGSSSIDFGNRSLNSATGQPVISWTGQTGTYSTYLYNYQTIDSITRGNLYIFNTQGGQRLTELYFDANVLDNELVYLETDGIWYQVDQTTDSSTKMLGIAKDISSQTGSVITEGDLVVTTGAGYPRVANAGYGLPVYIKQGAGTAMSTTVPATGYVRLLGHCYWNNSAGGGSDWIMKFRPSHEWVQI